MSIPELPDSIWIGPIKYSVSSKESDINRDKAECEDNKLLGRIVWCRQSITLDPSQGWDMLAATLLHEVIHGVLMNVGQNTEDTEHVIAALAPGMLDVLRRNPELVEFLVGQH